MRVQDVLRWWVYLLLLRELRVSSICLGHFQLLSFLFLAFSTECAFNEDHSYQKGSSIIYKPLLFFRCVNVHKFVMLKIWLAIRVLLLSLILFLCLSLCISLGITKFIAHFRGKLFEFIIGFFGIKCFGLVFHVIKHIFGFALLVLEIHVFKLFFSLRGFLPCIFEKPISIIVIEPSVVFVLTAAIVILVCSSFFLPPRPILLLGTPLLIKFLFHIFCKRPSLLFPICKTFVEVLLPSVKLFTLLFLILVRT